MSVLQVELEQERQEEQAAVRPRRLTPLRLVAMVVAGAVAAFVAVYVVFFTPDSPPPLSLSTAAAPAVGAPAGVWSVGAGSVAGYRVREKLLSLPAPNDAVGRTGAITGSFRLDDVSGGVAVRAGMRIEADLSTLRSDADRRDDHMRTMGIETDRFPTATFVTDSDVVLAADARSAMVRGDLTLHGVTRTVDVPVQAAYDGTRIEVVGTLSFPWAMFAMEQPSQSYVTVESDPTMEFQLFFDHTAP